MQLCQHKIEEIDRKGACIWHLRAQRQHRTFLCSYVQLKLVWALCSLFFLFVLFISDRNTELFDRRNERYGSYLVRIMHYTVYRNSPLIFTTRLFRQRIPFSSSLRCLGDLFDFPICIRLNFAENVDLVDFSKFFYLIVKLRNTESLVSCHRPARSLKIPQSAAKSATMIAVRIFVTL